MPLRKNMRRRPTPEESARGRRAIEEEKKYKEATIAQGREMMMAHRLGCEALAELKEERQRQGLSLEDLRKRTGMSRAAISRLENEERPNPTLGTLVRLASAMGVQLTLGIKRGG